ncbi:MAG: YggS family pyridoxal phosphate-dependent enzyme [Oscillospiraceae bacterium]|nr:YggS family pyridoxal phosphate-dependent enzyme [Oscillospiraceae bacterium]
MTIADKIKRVREAIAQAAIESGRESSDITLVAAAKSADADGVRQAIIAGVDAVGENRVQDMTEKYAQNAYTGTPLHFIGHLQSNKVGKVVGVCDLIESADSVKLLEMIGKKAMELGIIQNVLIEVNIGREPSKSGIFPEELPRMLDTAAAINGINVRGLMAIPPILGNPIENCYYFETMFNLFVDIRGKKYDNVCMQFLSMGMSGSYIEAIRAGANMVRIGSAIFER